MFGTNPIRKRVDSDGRVLLVQEVFDTVQGEGPDVGTPAMFIRLWGCNLACYFCDTDFETNAQAMSVDELVTRAKSRHLVVLTGGEPMRQNIARLVSLLCIAGHRVQIETAGTLWFMRDYEEMVFAVKNRWSIVCSPKTPRVHPNVLLYADAFKYIISGEDEHDEHGIPVVHWQRHSEGKKAALATPAWRASRPESIFVQPMDESLPYTPPGWMNDRNRALCVELAMKHGYRVCLQTHKILNLP